MIVTEYYKTRSDGVVLNRTYSDAGVMIERNGVRYTEAIDPVELDRQYTETDDHINTLIAAALRGQQELLKEKEATNAAD